MNGCRVFTGSRKAQPRGCGPPIACTLMVQVVRLPPSAARTCAAPASFCSSLNWVLSFSYSVFLPSSSPSRLACTWGQHRQGA